MPMIENLEFNGAPQIVQYIPNVEDIPEPEPGSSPLDFSEQKNSGPIEMDFSTPIQDVMPSAAFESDETPGLNGPYRSPSNNRVVGISAGVVQAEPSTASKMPMGLTKEQLHALVAGIAAVVAFSKPVQDKLSTVVPNFMGDSGALSLTGMVVTALIAAIVFYVANRVLENQS